MNMVLARFFFVLSIFFFVSSGQGRAQCTGLTFEVDTAFYAPMPLTGSLPGSASYDFDAENLLNGYVSYLVYATFTNPTDVLSSLDAINGGSSMFIDAPCGCFNQLTYTDVMLGGFQNPAFFFLEPEGRYDTYWTIGQTPGEYAFYSLLNPPGVYTSSTLCSSDIVDGTVVVPYITCGTVAVQCISGCAGNPACIAACSSAQAACDANVPNLSNAAGSDLKILIARVTTCGDFNISACLQTFVEGNQTDIDLWCPDSEAGALVVENPCAHFANTNSSVTETSPLICSGEAAVFAVAESSFPASYSLWRSEGPLSELIEVQAGPVFAIEGFGDYFVSILDENGCRDTTDVFSVDFVEPFFVHGSTTSPPCFGEQSGSISCVVEGAHGMSDVFLNGEYTGSVWNSDSLEFDGLGAGLYTVVALDTLGCSASFEFEISEPSALQLIPYTIPVSCGPLAETHVGYIEVFIIGGVGPYTLFVDGIQTDSQCDLTCLQWDYGYATFYEPGSHSFYAIDANGCSTGLEVALGLEGEDFDGDGVCDDWEVLGCTVPIACNFSPLATEDDQSCAFYCPGCMDSTACNFDPGAKQSDSSCLYPADLFGASHFDCQGLCLNDSDGDGVCDEDEVFGCLVSFACNYNASATESDVCDFSSCAGCWYPFACNYDPTATIYDGSCVFGTCEGCTHPLACNFNPTVTGDDGSCVFPDACGNCNASVPPNTDCNGNCLNDADSDGVCDENEVPGCLDPLACNFNPEATEPAPCSYPEADVDCDGQCIHDMNENNVCDLVEFEELLLHVELGLYCGTGTVWNPELMECLPTSCTGDLNGDGAVSVSDLLDFLAVYGTNCFD